jgi:hypothetical protein
LKKSFPVHPPDGGPVLTQFRPDHHKIARLKQNFHNINKRITRPHTSPPSPYVVFPLIFLTACAHKKISKKKKNIKRNLLTLKGFSSLAISVLLDREAAMLSSSVGGAFLFLLPAT